MKKCILASLILLSCASWIVAAKAPSAPQPLLSQEIRYTCDGAREVFLVWNINRHQLPDSVSRPAGSFVRDTFVYTPMRLEAGVFRAHLSLKAQTQLNYRFWITRGPRGYAMDLWDGAKPGDTLAVQQERHTLCAENNIVLVESRLQPRPAAGLSLLDYSGRLLIAAVVLLLIFFGVQRFLFTDISFRLSPAALIVSSALALFAFMLMARVSVMKLSWDFYLHPFDHVKHLSWIGFYDLLYVSVLTLVFLTGVFVFRKQESTARALGYVFAAIAIASVAVALANIRIVELQGRPYNFYHVYYASFLDESFRQKDFSEALTTAHFKDIAMVAGAALLLILAVAAFSTQLFGKLKLGGLALVLLLGLDITYLVKASSELKTHNANYDQLSNPVTELLFSVNPFAEEPQLFTMALPDSLKHFSKQKVLSLTGPYAALNGKIKNVIVVMMSSVAANYTSPLDSIYKATPWLQANLQNAIVFRNMYAQQPSVHASLVSLLNSVQPWLSTKQLTEAHPHLGLPSLGSELKKKGYRTASFNAGDNNEEGLKDYLGSGDFDLVKDARRVRCKEGAPGRISDACAERELISWLRVAPANPFFAVLQTRQTTEPFYREGEEKKFRTNDTLLHAYLNALSTTDVMLEKLVADLKHNKLYESTLLVLVSDQGRAFAPPARRRDGLYEDQVHVPCIFINPLLKQETIGRPATLADVGPTILNVLGCETPYLWQGSSLLAGEAAHRIYFFSPDRGYLFGYKEGNRKYIYHAGSNKTEIYDLNTDPYETNNLAEQHPDEVNACHMRLAAWVRHQKVYMDARIRSAPLLAVH